LKLHWAGIVQHPPPATLRMVYRGATGVSPVQRSDGRAGTPGAPSQVPPPGRQGEHLTREAVYDFAKSQTPRSRRPIRGRARERSMP
jgi:hypothetical protein